jgi:hypothetical protein
VTSSSTLAGFVTYVEMAFQMPPELPDWMIPPLETLRPSMEFIKEVYGCVCPAGQTVMKSIRGGTDEGVAVAFIANASGVALDEAKHGVLRS